MTQRQRGGLTVKKQFCCRLCIAVLCLLLAGLLNLLLPMAAWAEPSDSLEISGDGVNNPVKLTMSQLQSIKQYQHVYSTINTWPTKRWYVGEGIKIRDLLDLAGIKAEARMIIFTSNDGYSITLTVKELLQDKRYYFPHLMDNSASDGTVPGSASDAEEVEPILALLSAEGKQNPAEMNDMNALLFLCGQRAVTEQTNTLFLKYISKIEVLTQAPPQWDKPRASITSGKVSSGTLIELNNKRNDTDKIHYTTDGSTPTINSPVFNWSAKRWWGQRPGDLGSVNKPIELNRDTIIKAVTIGPGKEDSEVVTFSYQIGTADEIANQAMPGGPPAGITLDQSQVQLKAGGTFELEATVGPDNAADKRVTWSSDNTRVATVDNHGLITVTGTGTAIITARTVVGDFTASCKVVVGNESNAGQTAEPVVLSLKKDELQETPVEPEAPEINQEHSQARENATDDSNTIEVPEPPAAPEVPDANYRYLASKEAATVDAHTTNAASQLSDSLAGRILEVSAESVPVPIEQIGWDIYTTMICLVLFLSGAVKRYREYIKEGTR